ncbi:hypothetical protein Tco_1363100 [Tanacetum coccineum]
MKTFGVVRRISQVYQNKQRVWIKNDDRDQVGIKKFDGKNDFGLWQVRMKALLEQQGLATALEELHAATIMEYDSKSRSEHIDEFHKLVGDLAAIITVISDEDQALLLLTSLPSSYDNFVETLLYGRDTLKLEDVLATLNSRELQKMTKAKGNGGEGLYVRGRSGQRDMEQGIDSVWLKSQGRSSRLRCYICQSEENLKRDCPRYNHKKSQGFVRNKDQVSGSGADGYDSANVMMAMSVEELLDWIMDSEGSYHVVTRKTLKGRKQLGEYQTGWKIKMGNVLDFCNKISTQQCMKSEVAKHLGVAVIQQQNRRSPSLATGFKTPIDMSGFFCWLASIKQGMLEPVKAKNMGFNESGEYKKTFIGFGVGTGLVKVLQGVEFEVEPQEDYTFEVEPHGNVDHVVGSQEVQTQNLIYYHSTRDREQHLTWELFSYKKDSNEASFAVAAVDKIYAHESLTFNNTVACKVISKWKADLKDDMDARSDVYVLSNGCKKCSDDIDGYYWEYTPGMFIHICLYIDDMVFSCGCKAEIWATKGLLDKANGNVLGMKIFRDQSGNTLRVSQFRFYNEKLVQTLLERRFILSLEGSLPGDCDVEKNGKWSCIYTVRSQEYQVVCMRLDIAFADVGMLDKFDRGLQTNVQVFVDFDYAMGRLITVMGRSITREAAKEAIWLKGLAIESGFELNIVAGIDTGALSKAIPGLRFQHRLNLLSIGIG